MIRRYPLSLYLAGAAAARTGDELSGPALLLLGIAITGSASTASWLLAGLTASAALGGPALGAVLDRSPRPGRVLAYALGLYAVGLTVIAVGLGRAPTPLFLGVAVLAGLLNPALAGGWTAQLPHVLDGKDLAKANALDAMTFSTASLLGPGVAGLLSTVAGAPAALAVAVFLVTAALPAAWSLPVRAVSTSSRRLSAGFAGIWASRPLRRATATSMVSYVGVGMSVVCFPLLGLHELGGAGRGTLLMTAAAAAALVTNAVLARYRPPMTPDTIVWASTGALAAGALLAALAGGVVGLVLAAAVTGFGEGPQLTALFAVRHREATDRLRAQIFTTGSSVKITAFAAGSAIAGPLATVSLTACLLAAAGAQLLAALTYTAFGRLGVRRPSPARAA
jgi:MFS family permease